MYMQDREEQRRLSHKLTQPDGCINVIHAIEQREVFISCAYMFHCIKMTVFWDDAM
jgi:hypothetical protein